MFSVFVLLPFHAGEPTSNILTAIQSTFTSFSFLTEECKKVVCLAFDGESLDENQKKSITQIFTSNKENVDYIISYNTNSFGLQKNLNAAIRRLNIKDSDFIVRLDCDDLMLEKRLPLQIDHMLKNPSTDVLASCAEINHFGKLRITPKSYTGYIKITDMFLKNKVVHSTVCFRGSVFKTFGLYDEDFTYGQDYEFWLRILSNGGKIYISPKVLVRINHDISIYRRRLKAQNFYIKALWQWRYPHIYWLVRLVMACVLQCCYKAIRIF